MENGLAAGETTMLRRPADRCHVYDLPRRECGGSDEKSGMMLFPAGGAAGMEHVAEVFMVTDHAIETWIECARPEVAGESLGITIRA
jgi:hypothetical protein